MEPIWDNYIGRTGEPVEDRSILQPDGTRACYNWECKEGFQEEAFNNDPNKIGLDDGDEAALFLKRIHRK